MTGWPKLVSIALKVALPILTVAASIFVARWLIANKPKPEDQAVARDVPQVRATRIESRSVCFPIRSQGTVQPRTESTLVARVGGRIVSVHKSFDEGGFFRTGERLVEIEGRDHAVRLRRLDASLRAVRAESAEAEHQLDRLKKLHRSATSAAELDRAQALFDATAARAEELEAQREEAQNALNDTEVEALFDGCIREKLADVGQYVTPGTPLATCFATDAAEVRLPVTDPEFAFLDLPLGRAFEPGAGPEVVLEAHFAGVLRRWTGTIVRSEPIVDSRSRMVYLVASVPRPYEATGASDGQPLAVGMFVAATIRCPPIAGAAVLPEECVGHDGKLFEIGPGSVLVGRDVEVLWREGAWVVVRGGGLADGALVCATRLDRAIPEMQVEVAETFAPELPDLDRNGVVDFTAIARLTARHRDQPAAEE